MSLLSYLSALFGIGPERPPVPESALDALVQALAPNLAKEIVMAVRAEFQPDIDELTALAGNLEAAKQAAVDAAVTAAKAADAQDFADTQAAVHTAVEAVKAAAGG